MNFVQAYKIWASGNEAPDIYHQWSGLSVISSLVSRRVWVPQGQDYVMGNLYILLVGPAGNKKSTAMKAARGIVREFREKSSPVPPKNQTWQSIVQDLGDEHEPYKKHFVHQGDKFVYSHASMFCNEFATLLKTDPLGWVTFLTDIYDEDSYEYKIKNAPRDGKKLDFIQNPYITFLGCMTPELTANSIQEGIITTGFSRRCIFVYANRSSKCVPRRTTTTDQLNARDWLIQWGTKLSMVQGPFVWEDNAVEYFDHWYTKNRSIMASLTDGFLASWLDSKNQIVIKVAMMLSLADSLDLRLRKQDIEAALLLIDETELHFHKIFAAAGRNPIAMISMKIISQLEQNHKPVLDKQIYRDMHPHGSTDEIKEAINHLLSTNQICARQGVVDSIVITHLGTAAAFADFDASRKVK